MWTGTDLETHLQTPVTSTEQMLVMSPSDVTSCHFVIVCVLKGFMLMFDLTDEDAFYQSRYYLGEIESVSKYITM